MLALLRQAAGEGEPQAQETLAWILLAGPTLYGTAVKADRCEAVHWLRQAVAKGNQTAKSQLDFLNRLRNAPDRKSTRLNSSHLVISYAVFCLKKKKRSKIILKNNLLHIILHLHSLMHTTIYIHNIACL